MIIISNHKGKLDSRIIQITKRDVTEAKRDVTEECEFWIFGAILEARNPLKCWKPLENHKIYTSYCKKHYSDLCWSLVLRTDMG